MKNLKNIIFVVVLILLVGWAGASDMQMEIDAANNYCDRVADGVHSDFKGLCG